MERELDKFFTFHDMLTADFFEYSKINKTITGIKIPAKLYSYLEKYFHLLDKDIEIIKTEEEEDERLIFKYICNKKDYAVIGFWYDLKNKTSYNFDYISDRTIEYALKNNIHINNGEVFVDYLYFRAFNHSEEIYGHIRSRFLNETGDLLDSSQYTMKECLEGKSLEAISYLRTIINLLISTDEEIIKLYLEKRGRFFTECRNTQYEGRVDLIYLNESSYIVNTNQHIIIYELGEFEFGYNYTVIDKTVSNEKFNFQGEEYSSTDEDFEVLTMLYSEEYHKDLPLLEYDEEEEPSVYEDMKRIKAEYAELMLEIKNDFIEHQNNRTSLINSIGFTKKRTKELINKIKEYL
ncbi:TPA: hypothetical protein NHK58_001423 [Pseudomonas aeruginosa]|nr:hypothetical protein [Pseudomonas aeruginosa]